MLRRTPGSNSGVLVSFAVAFGAGGGGTIDASAAEVVVVLLVLLVVPVVVVPVDWDDELAVELEDVWGGGVGIFGDGCSSGRALVDVVAVDLRFFDGTALELDLEAGAAGLLELPFIWECRRNTFFAESTVGGCLFHKHHS